MQDISRRHLRAESMDCDPVSAGEELLESTVPQPRQARRDEKKDDTSISKAEAAGDHACWTVVLATAFLTTSLLSLAIFNYWTPLAIVEGIKQIRLHSFEYFIMCMVGGVFSGLPHTMLCPLDVVKCRVQVGEYTSMSEGFQTMYAEAQRSNRHWIPAFLILCYRGVAPTFFGYSFQGSLKFGLYEFFKFTYQKANPDFTKEHKMLVFLAASATAEFFADIALCPWESVKIKMQTTRMYPPKLSVVMPRMWASEGLSGFYKSIVPLWTRQIPYTMVKFTVFEKAVAFTYGYLVDTNTIGPGGHLVVSLGCGCVAGALCAIVSHPADTLVSKINQRGGATKQLSLPSSPTAAQQSQPSSDVLSIAKELGCGGLWKGMWVRVAFIGVLTAMQWVIYDSFKVTVGLPTTGSVKK